MIHNNLSQIHNVKTQNVKLEQVYKKPKHTETSLKNN